MALTSWLLFGFGLGVLFTLSAVSTVTRKFLKTFGNHLDRWTQENAEGFAAAQVLLRELEAAAHVRENNESSDAGGTAGGAGDVSPGDSPAASPVDPALS